MEPETMIDQEVTYTLEHEGKFFIVERVPARVRLETGEHFFAPETVEHLQAVIGNAKAPVRIIQTPVYRYV